MGVCFGLGMGCEQELYFRKSSGPHAVAFYLRSSVFICGYHTFETKIERPGGFGCVVLGITFWDHPVLRRPRRASRRVLQRERRKQETKKTMPAKK